LEVVKAGRISTSPGAAQHDFGPFVEVIRTTGPMAKTNPIRFSTKYHDDETDLLFYGCQEPRPEHRRRVAWRQPPKHPEGTSAQRR
jgi:hypothetical protein